VLLFADPTSVEEIAPRIRDIARAVGVPEVGELLAGRTESDLAAILDGVPTSAERPTVAFLYMRGQAGVYLLAGPASGADSMIRAAGGIDAGTAMGLENPFTPITSEALAKAAPDVILVTTTGLESVGGIDGLVQIPGIAQTPAGENRHVVTMDDGLLYSFGPRTPGAIEQLSRDIYQWSGTPQ
jgi:iron complex transport system substrate-binding protein